MRCGVVPPHEECNEVAQAILRNPKGSYEMNAWLRYSSSSGSVGKIDPDSVAAPCPAPISCERNPSLNENTP